MNKPETVADVAANIRRAVEYIEKQYPGAKTLDAAPILRNMKRWAAQIERAMAASAVPVARVAEVHMTRCTIEWTSGPLPVGTLLYGYAPPVCWQHRPGSPCPWPASCRSNGCSAVERELYPEDAAPPAVPVESLGKDAADPVPPHASVPDVLTADDVQWVVNDNAELGVMIRGQAFFLYKGDSLVYDDAKHDDGTPMYYRTVGKREFGECAYPINHSDYSKQGTVSLDDSDRWQLLPPTTPEETP